MKIEVSSVKGFTDYLPPESLKRERIKEIVKKQYKLFGFLPVETPIIEFDELMRSKPNEEDEDEAIADRFRLKDRGNRSLGLRYEFTFQLARIFKENPNIKLPFRRFQIGPNFRDEPIRQGRTRQFTQCDADIIGDSSISADSDCLFLISEILKELKIENEIQINNRNLLTSIIESVQINATEQVLRELDKLEKIGTDQVKVNLKKYTSANQVITLLKLLEKDLSFFKENAFDGIKELEELKEKCKLYGLKTKFVPTLTRGFAYYTGNIFELTISNKKTVIAAGGRFDKIVGKFINREIPAVGISFSLEALMGLCPKEISQLKIKQYPKVIVISFNQDKEAITITKKLRKNNISTITTSGQPSKALDYANSQNIPYVIFLGNHEIEQKKFKIKDMKSGSESMLTEKQLINKINK